MRRGEVPAFIFAKLLLKHLHTIYSWNTDLILAANKRIAIFIFICVFIKVWKL